MASCREIEKMVMPYINHQLDEVQLEQFLKHIKSCSSWQEELEIYYTVSLGLRQLDSGSGVYDIAGSLEESMENAWAHSAHSAASQGDLLCSGYSGYCFCSGHAFDADPYMDPGLISSAVQSNKQEKEKPWENWF